MSNFKRMHIVAGTLAIICLLLMSSKCWDTFNDDWRRGIGFTASVVMGGYMLGCVVGLLVNLAFLLFVEVTLVS